jgi:hypothetical protein
VAAFGGDLVHTGVAKAVEEVGAVPAGLYVEPEDLDAADLHVANAPVGGMDHEASAGEPLVDVAREDGRRRLAARVQCLPLVDR